MDESKKDILVRCIKDTNDAPTINLWIKRFYDELKYLMEKINKVLEFNSFRVTSDDISHLDEKLIDLKVDVSNLEIFNNQNVRKLIDFILCFKSCRGKQI